MQLNAVSTPVAAWLWNLPETMLSMKPLSFSESACARLSLNAPFAANDAVPAAGLAPALSSQVQAFWPIIRSGPEYGASAIPCDPNTRSDTSNHPFVANCVDEKLTCTSPGYVKITW